MGNGHQSPRLDNNGAEGEPKEKRVSNLALRLLTALVMVPVLLALLFVAPKIGFVSLLTVTVALGSHELSAMVCKENAASSFWHLIWSVTASLGVFFGALYEFLSAGTLVAFLSIGGLVVALLSVRPIETAMGRIGWMIAGPAYIGGLLAPLAKLHQQPEGGYWVLLSLMLAWLADTGGYFFGRFFGRRPLWPALSPKKTIEGGIGALLGSTGGALLAHFVFLPSIPLVHAVGLGIVGGAIGQAGDLFESLLKRASGVKDSGKIVPGHGGILDRIDALLFTGTVTWLYVALVY